MSNPNPPLENLTPFPPGVSGNPKGKPKGAFNIKTIAKQLAEDPKTWDNLPVNRTQIAELKKMVGNDKTYAQALILAWLAKGLTDSKFAGIVQELLDGKGKTELSIDPDLFDETELTIKVIRRDDSGIKRQATSSEGSAE